MCLRLSGWRDNCGDKDPFLQLEEPPLSTADHHPCDLAVFSVPFEPADGQEMLLEPALSASSRDPFIGDHQTRDSLCQAVAQKKPVA